MTRVRFLSLAPFADVAQLVEQEFCKLQVTGSIPVTSSMRVSYKGITLGFQPNDAGSIPVTRSNVAVAERQGNGLQPRFMQVRLLSATPKVPSFS